MITESIKISKDLMKKNLPGIPFQDLEKPSILLNVITFRNV